MNEDELISKIEEEISVTERKIKDLRNLTKPISPSDAIGRVSRMDAINNKSVNENSLRQVEVKLSNLKRVLENVGTPNFGICVKCKNQIPIGRILIRPQSLLCVNCAR
ncbi:TraR/DksA C4-type zinc finger protein [Winogradskyella sp. KYW1333]|uniref:TraR/DksA family transcriptional regulator n=1 Tax=unclassified Winogradskyella TaxID=2615021 RepID=UPI000DF34B42|nr:TraR/DksA C4-type zinc finger protein [Winogradskyella sp. KYW1333]RCT53724.1 TraR/DksA family transcriptional regulator [Winogradskyella sp. KYW1333]